MRPRVGICGLLLAVNAFALLVPLAAIVALRVFDDQLIRRTEAQLIGQSVLIAEAWRAAWLEEAGIAPDRTPSIAPPDADNEPWFPIEPTLRLRGGVLPPAAPASRVATDRVGIAWRAGERIEPILERAVRRNLSSARVLDARGCVVASSGAQRGDCLDHLPEVRRALGGDYAAVLRERGEDQGPVAAEGISRRGRVRVHTALPILAGGEVTGVVRMARTALDPAKALWFDRRRLLLALAGCALLTGGLSLFLSRTIARPLRGITAAARAVVQGRRPAPFEAPRLAPDELHALSHALDSMTHRLADRADSLAEFATTVSHELKTPIAGIRGAAELLTTEWPRMSDSERARFLANIESGALRMQRLVTRLLELARIPSTRETDEELRLERFLSGIAAEYGAPIRCRVDDPKLRVRAHADQLESAVRNLLDNAVRHGQGRPIDLEASRKPEGVAIRVRDRGPGISTANRERVFDRFFTTERERGGTGLGLAIARAVAERRGGRLEVETGPAGTCFELVL